MIYVFADIVSGSWAVYSRQYLRAFAMSGLPARACWYGPYGPQPEILPPEDVDLLSLGSVCPAPAQAVVRIGKAEEVISQGRAGQRGPRNIAITSLTKADEEAGRAVALASLYDEVWVGSQEESRRLWPHFTKHEHETGRLRAVWVLPPPISLDAWQTAGEPARLRGTQYLALGPWVEVEPALHRFLSLLLGGDEDTSPHSSILLACDDSPFPAQPLDRYLAQWRAEKGGGAVFAARPRVSLVARPRSLEAFRKLAMKTDCLLYHGADHPAELGWFEAGGGRYVGRADGERVEPALSMEDAASSIRRWLGALPPSPHVW